MKSLAVFVIIMLLISCLTACGAQKVPAPGPETGTETGPEAEQPQAVREKLPLQYMPVMDEELELDPPQMENAGFSWPEVGEIRDLMYDGDPALDAFADFIRERFGIELDSRWKAFVHYYDDQKTVGMAEFMYTVGEIDTNRCIIFNLSGGTADWVSFKNLDCEIDEDGLLQRVDLFRMRYEQERYEPGEGETFKEEKYSYTYYCNTGALVYCYNVFFSYGPGVINNDWGTICYISEEGEASFFGVSASLGHSI